MDTIRDYSRFKGRQRLWMFASRHINTYLKKEFILKGKKMLPLEACFSFRVEPFPEGSKTTFYIVFSLERISVPLNT